MCNLWQNDIFDIHQNTKLMLSYSFYFKQKYQYTLLRQ